MPYYFYDATYILVLIGALISMIASWNVKNTFRTYSRVWNSRNIPSQDIAQMILHDAGIYDVRIERIRGDLTDHYSPNESPSTVRFGIRIDIRSGDWCGSS